MNQIVAVAVGGALGAVFRFLISSGVYQWLGKGFPYGTLAVNLTGSFLIGLMTEALFLQRIALSLEYRSAILVGLFGSLTTFSTFSLDTLYLFEQGHFVKASLNIILSVFACLFAAWLGLSVGRILFLNSTGTLMFRDFNFPVALLTVSAIGAFIIGLFSTLLLSKTDMYIEHSVAMVFILIGVFITFSSLYLVLFYIEHGYAVEIHMKSISIAVVSNIAICSLSLWLGLLLGKQI